MNHPSENQPAPVVRRPPQMSLGFMMLMMIVFAIFAAGLLYASRVPAVQEEISVLSGGKVGSKGSQYGRLAHITFVVFTYSSPLLLAGFLSSVLSVVRWVNGRRGR